MTKMTTTSAYAAVLKHRARFQRALGRHLIETIEAGHRVEKPAGTDMSVEALIALSGASHKRRIAALRAWRQPA